MVQRCIIQCFVIPHQSVIIYLNRFFYQQRFNKYLIVLMQMIFNKMIKYKKTMEKYYDAI